MKSKKEKVTAARKNAETLKAKKKALRNSKSGNGNAAPTGKGKGKGKSIVGQSKAKKSK